jgi:hypothetical protein
MNFFEFWKAVFCLEFFRLYIGGDSSSDASTNTTNYTTTNVTDIDRRAVASEQAQSITGDNNIVTHISTDNGAVAKAIDLGQFSVGAAFDSLKAQAAGNLATIAGVFDLAKQYGANAQTSSGAVMDLAKSTAQIAADAYKNSADVSSSNRTIILVGLAVIGVVGIALVRKKG